MRKLLYIPHIACCRTDLKVLRITKIMIITQRRCDEIILSKPQRESGLELAADLIVPGCRISSTRQIQIGVVFGAGRCGGTIYSDPWRMKVLPYHFVGILRKNDDVPEFCQSE